MTKVIFDCNVYNRKTNKVVANIKTRSLFRMRLFINKYGYNNEDKYYLKFKEIFKNE